jgi:hypothetical protein
MPRARRVLIALCLALAACGSSRSAAPRPVAQTANVITREEIEASVASDLLELVITLRPHWIPRQSRDAVDVYHQQLRLRNVLEMRAYHPSEVESVEYLSAGQAQFRIQDARGKPVIILVPRERH